jgi:hypothetical protein
VFKSVDDGSAFDSILKTCIVIPFTIELIFSIIRVLILEKGNNKDNTPMVLISYDSLEIIMTAITIYFFAIYCILIGKIMKDQRAIHSCYLFVFLIFIITLQKYLIELIFSIDKGRTQCKQAIIAVNETITAIELVFIMIPFNHHFNVDSLKVF